MLLSRLRLSPADICDAESVKRDLATKSVRGGLSTVASQLTYFVLQLGGTAVLARLLTPNDYGLVGMVVAVISFAAVFRAFGLSAATIQRATISREQVSALFWINLGFSVILAAGVAAASPLIARFYHEPSLGPVSAVLALSLVLSGLSIQHAALLRRHVKMGGLALANIASEVVNVGVAIALAAAGLRYWALVCGTLASALTLTALTFFLCPWIPGLPRRRSGVRQMVGFGATVMGFDMANYFARNLDNVLIGRHSGAVSLGYYSRAYSLFMLPISQIRGPVFQVALPVLSSLQAEPGRYAKYFTRISDILATLVVPLTALVVVEADFLVEVLLGPQWQGVVPLFRILASVGLVQGVTTAGDLVPLSMGFSRRFLRYGIGRALILSASFFAGLHWGAAGVATAYAIASYAILVPALFYCFRGTSLRVGRFLTSLALPCLVAAVAAGAAVLSRYLLGYHSTAANVVAILVFVVVYASVSLLRPMVRDTLRRVHTSLFSSGKSLGT